MSPHNHFMRLTTLDAHVGGAAVRLITSGLPTLEGAGLGEKQDSFERQADRVRCLLCREPRGHSGTTGVVLTEPEHSSSAAGLLCFNGAGYLTLSGHALIGAVTLALDGGLIVLAMGDDSLHIDTVAGPVAVRVARDAAGRVGAVRYVGPPAFVKQAGVSVWIGNRTVRADIVWSGSRSLAIVDAEAAAVPLVVARSLELRRAGVRIAETLGEQLSGASAGSPQNVDGVVFIGPAISPEAELRSALVHADGTVERCPSGAATVAVTTVLQAMGMAAPGRRIVHEGLLGTSFTAAVAGIASAAPPVGCEIEVEGRAYATGEHAFRLEDGDPLPDGVVL